MAGAEGPLLISDWLSSLRPALSPVPLAFGGAEDAEADAWDAFMTEADGPRA